LLGILFLFLFFKFPQNDKFLPPKKNKRKGSEHDPDLTLQRVEPLQHVKDD
jgi:hypothetical protein